LLNEKSEPILSAAWSCLKAVIDGLEGGAELMRRLPFVSQAVRLIGTNYTRQLTTAKLYAMKMTSAPVTFNATTYLPGFCLPKKGISCLLPVFKEGLLNGIPDMKEQSAMVLCECIKLADGDSLKSSVMAITGPLIRVLGERYSWTVKSQVLDAIYFLLLKVGVTLRPFLPQLQPTFLKNLNDANRLVRLKSGYALARLLPMNPKLDQIVLEVANLTKNSSEQDELDVKETQLNALRLCLDSVGAKCKDETKQTILTMLRSDAYLYHSEQAIRSVSAGVLGSLTHYLSDQLEQLAKDLLADQEKSHKYLESNCTVLGLMFKYANDSGKSSLFKDENVEVKCVSFLAKCAMSDRDPVRLSALRAATFFIEYKIVKDDSKMPVDVDLVQTMVKCMNHGTPEMKFIIVELVTHIHLVNPREALNDGLLKAFLPMLVNGAREKALAIRNASEIAMSSIMHYKQKNSIYNECLEIVSAKDSFADCVKSIGKENINKKIRVEDYVVDRTLIRIET